MIHHNSRILDVLHFLHFGCFACFAFWMFYMLMQEISRGQHKVINSQLVYIVWMGSFTLHFKMSQIKVLTLPLSKAR